MWQSKKLQPKSKKFSLIDILSILTTDSQLSQSNVIVLEDDWHFCFDFYLLINAIASISTLAPLGIAATSTADLHGASPWKKDA